MRKSEQTAARLARHLDRNDVHVVLVESCTAGMATALLGGVPGISRFLCGSIVAYQDEFKSTWLGVDPALIALHTSVSAPVTRELAEQALARTPMADLACAITGHLGPDAPVGIDGTIFVAIANQEHSTVEHRVRLTTMERKDRQLEAAETMLHYLITEVG